MSPQNRPHSDRSNKQTRGPGRPTLNDLTLIQNRNSLLHSFGAFWAEFAWELKRARDIHALTKALHPLKGGTACSVIALLLEPDGSETSKPFEIRQTNRELHEALIVALKAQEKYNKQLECCRETGSFIAESKRKNPAFRIRAEGLRTIKEEDDKRQEKLRQLNDALEKANTSWASLQKKSQHQMASFAQAELLDFIQSKRYAFTPQNLAKALAGLPEISWRQSFERCSKLLRGSKVPDHMVMKGVHPNYEVFRALDYILTNRYPKSLDDAMKLLQRTVPDLPARFKPGREVLEENWLCLLEAVRNCWQKPLIPGKLSYAFGSAFVKSFYRPKGVLDRVLAEQEQIRMTQFLVTSGKRKRSLKQRKSRATVY